MATEAAQVGGLRFVQAEEAFGHFQHAAADVALVLTGRGDDRGYFQNERLRLACSRRQAAGQVYVTGGQARHD